MADVLLIENEEFHNKTASTPKQYCALKSTPVHARKTHLMVLHGKSLNDSLNHAASFSTEIYIYASFIFFFRLQRHQKAIRIH